MTKGLSSFVALVVIAFSVVILALDCTPVSGKKLPYCKPRPKSQTPSKNRSTGPKSSQRSTKLTGKSQAPSKRSTKPTKRFPGKSQSAKSTKSTKQSSKTTEKPTNTPLPRKPTYASSTSVPSKASSKAQPQKLPSTNAVKQQTKSPQQVRQTPQPVSQSTSAPATTSSSSTGVARTNKASSIRGTWFSTYEPRPSADNVQKLKELGVNTIYVDAWNNGKVFFQSSTMENLIGNAGIGMDLIDLAIQSGKQHGMKVIAWFEYGNMASYQSPAGGFAKYAQQQGWLLSNGKLAHSYTWMDPRKKEVRQFLINIMLDVLKEYPELDGVQLDDHFGWPAELSGGVSAAQREATMTQFAKEVSQAIKSAYPNKILSLSPNLLYNARATYSVPFAQWSNLFDEFIPQTYRASAAQGISEMQKQISGFPNGAKLAMALRGDGAGSATTWTEFKKQMDFCKQKGVGYSIWSAKIMLTSYYNQLKQTKL